MQRSRILLWGGVTAVAVGAVLCALGWYGISGERFAERQLPYLASSTLPGAALIVSGAVMVAAALLLPTGPSDRAHAPDRAPPPDTAETPPPSSDGPLLRVPGGTLAHRPDCPLVAGKAEATEAGDATLDPCPVCDPWRP
ncbi:hypothetical protein AB0B30_27040 [Streptomyces narbonensis]|uniref:Secreted protein n=1 Tax=Streptomyces narbonensis TaxID=67333 RepID=A0ABV3CI33_9ACTN